MRRFLKRGLYSKKKIVSNIFQKIHLRQRWQCWVFLQRKYRTEHRRETKITQCKESESEQDTHSEWLDPNLWERAKLRKNRIHKWPCSNQQAPFSSVVYIYTLSTWVTSVTETRVSDYLGWKQQSQGKSTRYQILLLLWIEEERRKLWNGKGSCQVRSWSACFLLGRHTRETCPLFRRKKHIDYL